MVLKDVDHNHSNNKNNNNNKQKNMLWKSRLRCLQGRAIFLHFGPIDGIAGSFQKSEEAKSHNRSHEGLPYPVA